ncbi:hypothetical protein [Oleisolibacter albus]|uniref:hypothetical protein n=1 Tax=Oleisolibacter albus TaxID=2171757 RepID=UPI00139042C0|nr:hypothetical protein [Oleisolibacter albus]
MMSLSDHDHPASFPYQPVALKIIGDGILASALLRAADLPPDAQAEAVVLALLVGLAASAAAGGMLVRSGQRPLWDITSLSCLIAMAVLVLLHGSVLFAVLLAAFAWWRWQRLTTAED